MEPVTKINRQKQPRNDFDTSIFGRIQPQAADVEEAVLGGLMIEQESINEVLDILQPEIFYVDAHQLICRAIRTLHAEQKPYDILMVTQQLRSTEELERVGGSYYITTLTNRVASAANIRHHLLIIYQAYLQREIIQNSSEAIRDSFESKTDVFDLIDKQRIFYQTIDEPLTKIKIVPIAKQVDETIMAMEKASGSSQSTFGYSTGWKQLDKTTSGLVPGEVTVIAARPGMGKTALAISLANNLRRQGIITDIYSFESPYKTVIMRFMSQDLGIPLTHLRQGKVVDWLKVKDYGEELKIAGISIEDTARMNGEELEVRMRMRARNDGVQVVIIDYMQLMHMRNMNKNANREQEITAISRIIKTVAMETDTAMVPLSQLSRTVESRGGDKRPQLSDLRESGSIEQDADSVWFIYRPEYYKIMQDANGYSTQNVGIIDVAKNRNGETKDHEFLYIPTLMKFEEWPNELNKKYEPNADSRKGKKKKATDISRRDYTESQRNDDDSLLTTEDPLPF